MSNHTEKFHPHIPSDRNVREFTPRAILLGLFFGFFFAVANAYLALKLGTTISASIPAAILSMAVLKFVLKKGTILENNIVQTIATVGEGLAAGVIFTIPALILLGDSPSIGRIFILSMTGGILGILLMIPMRRFIIVKEHKTLPFPEGTACSQILKAGEKDSNVAIMAVWGFLSGALYKICTNAFYFWKEITTTPVHFFKNIIFTIDGTPALLGVGYIIGPRITGLMFAGGILAWWGLIPLIKIFGGSDVVIYPSTVPLDQMGPEDIWDQYIRYIGAGTLTVGGLYSLIKVFPLLFKTIHMSIKELFQGLIHRSHIERTDRDISIGWLLIGSLFILLFLWLFPGMPMNFFTIFLLLVLSFVFVAVTSITVGLVGSTSNPVSGMTITTLLITCILFVMLGWTERIYLISAITMGCVACCAICMAGTTSQDLKTGFLLGATPQKQQIAEILGCIIPSIALGYTIYFLNQAYQIGSAIMPAPQATLLSMIAKGVVSGNLPYGLVGIGALIGIVLILLDVSVLSFALGLYLPLSLTTATMVGGLVRAFVNKKTPSEITHEKGILLSSGLIGGDACIGIFIAALTIFKIIPPDAPSLFPNFVGFLAFGLLAVGIGAFTLKK